MKEIVIISDYPTDALRTDNLLNLINNIKSKEKEILLISHIMIPDYIISRCDYYMYDKKNELIDTELSNFNIDYCANINEFSFCSKEFSRINNNDYRYSVIKQFILSLNYLKMLKYDIVHFIEGDTNYNDLTEIDDNYDILTKTKYDSVIYQSPKMMSGNFFSFNLNKIDLKNFSPLNKEEIIKKIIHLKYSEEFTKKEILKDLNFFVKEYNITKYPILIGCSYSEYKNVWSSFFKINEEWNYVMKNVTNQDKKIKIYKSLSPHIIEFTLFSGGNWRMFPIKNINDNNFFDVYIDDVLFKKYNLKSDMLEFKDNFIKSL
jgi:hypothetical protein